MQGQPAVGHLRSRVLVEFPLSASTGIRPVSLERAEEGDISHLQDVSGVGGETEDIEVMRTGPCDRL